MIKRKRKRREGKNDVSYDSDDEEGEKDQVMRWEGKKELERKGGTERQTKKDRDRETERKTKSTRETIVYEPRGV